MVYFQGLEEGGASECSGPTYVLQPSLPHEHFCDSAFCS